MTPFQLSTQFSHWMFDVQEIADYRSTALQDAVDNLAPMELVATIHEENLAIRFFTRQIFVIFGVLTEDPPRLKKKWRLAATSSMYFRRFYAFNSLAEFDPRIITLACIFLAGKSENHFISLRDLRHIYPKITDPELLSAEMIVLEKLKFDLKVHHPQNCVHTLLAEMKRSLDAAVKARVSDCVNAWLTRCDDELFMLQTTPAIIAHSPMTLATFALCATANDEVKATFNLDKFFSETLTSTVWSDMKRQHGQLVAFAAEGRQGFPEVPMQVFMAKLKALNKWHLNCASSGVGDAEGTFN